MSDKCECGCHGAGGFGGSSDKTCCKCNGINFVVASMSSVEVETGVKQCLGCKAELSQCKCVWSAIRSLQHRVDTLIHDLHDWKDNINKSLKSSEVNSTPFKVFIEQHTNDERHRTRHEKLINSLGFEVIELKEALRFVQNQKNYDLPSIGTLNKQVQNHIDKIKDEGKSETIEKLKEKIDILMDCLNRKSMNIEALEQELKDERESYKCDVKNYEFRIKEMHQIICDRNTEIHKLKNNRYEDSCEPIKKTGVDRYGNEVPINEQTR